MAFYFAWVDKTDTTWSATYAREDESVLAFEVVQVENEFASLNIEVENPRIGLLATGRKQWAWLSRDVGTTVEPLFFGRLIGLPTDLQSETIQLSFLARPADWTSQQTTLAATLRVDPYWDPLWIEEERRLDPDAVLEGYSALWHIDRVTHTVSTSDVLEGAAGTINVAGDFFHDSLRMAFGAPPVRKVTVVADLFWDQTARGTVDISAEIATAAGGSGGRFTLLTGEGVVSEWPKPGTRIGAGWSVGNGTAVERVDGTEVVQDSYTIQCADRATVEFPYWTLRPTFDARYDVARQRQETVSFTMRASVQKIVTDPGEDDVINLTLSTQDVGTLGVDGVADERPIGSLRRPRFLQTDRGKRALRYLLCLARAHLRARARAVEITFECPFETLGDITCDHNVTIADPRLPGGTATGKVISYRLAADGDTGQIVAAVTIGCAVGNDDTVTAVDGTPVYVEDGYIEDDVQATTGGTVVFLGGEIGYGDFDTDPIDDDGVVLWQSAMIPANVVETITVSNTLQDQIEAITDQEFADAAAAFEALNTAYARICVTFLTLTGGPFHSEFDITVEPLALPKGIDLEAAAS